MDKKLEEMVNALFDAERSVIDLRKAIFNHLASNPDAALAAGFLKVDWARLKEQI